MAFDLSWLLEKRIVYARARGTVTAKELQAVVDAAADDIRRGNAPVHAILDLTAIEHFPARLTAFKDFMFPPPQPNTGSLLLISDNKVAQFLINVVAQLSKRNIYTFTTLDDGLAFLARTDATLPWFEFAKASESACV